jgi:hypothetical protein
MSVDKDRKIGFEELIGEMLSCVGPPGPAAKICPFCGQPAALWVAKFEGCGACFIQKQHEGEPVQ